jgi:hypothetical protein
MIQVKPLICCNFFCITGSVVDQWKRTWFRGVLAGLEAVGKILPFFRCSGTTIDLGLLKLWQDWKLLGKSCHSSGVQVKLLT